MNSTMKEPMTPVPPEAVARRIAEWRKISFEHRGPAIMIYPPDQRTCPWPGCDRVIAGVDFQLEEQGQPARLDGWLASWWQGPGLVGSCPGCGQLVLFGYFDKRPVTNVAGLADAMLPENWFQTAHISPK